MTTSASRAFQLETDFLSGVEVNFEAAKGKYLRGTKWQTSRDDDSDRLRALLYANRIYDRERLKSLPANRWIALHGFERWLLFGKRPTGVAIASVLSPMSHYASSEDADAPPIGLGDLSDHVRKLAGQARVPHLIGVCSPTGFTDEAKKAKLDRTNVTVALIEPDGHGGWCTSASGEQADPRVLKMFDPERSNEKVDRVCGYVEEHSADLLTGSLSVSSVARAMDLPEDVVRQGFERAASDEPELRVTKKEGEFLLYRGAAAPPQETRAMNVVERIKQLFSSEGAETEKINLLAERRAALAQRRDRIYGDIGKIEEKEADLLAQGKAAKSAVPKRRLAAQLAQLRKDIGRQNTTAAMLNKQIDIISTDIHNLTLIQQGEVAKLPDTTELTDNAVRAEEMLETLRADAELVGSLETGIEESVTSEEELAILSEFDQDETAAAEPKQVATPERPAGSRTEASSPAPPIAEPADEPPSAAGESNARSADAEPT